MRLSVPRKATSYAGSFVVEKASFRSFSYLRDPTRSRNRTLLKGGHVKFSGKICRYARSQRSKQENSGKFSRKGANMLENWGPAGDIGKIRR